ncbi:MBL fold metallo-hydrolase [Dyella sp. Tek66A03]|uniref:MBL fold metallo-hydrolase n=1 Tax=Dyella sp. Tek66A03 TaxID=3458298 RepID=UPI00403E7D42
MRSLCTSLILPALTMMLALPAASTDVAPASAAGGASYRLTVGKDEVIALADGNFGLDTTQLLVTPRDADLPTLLQSAHDGPVVTTSVNAYLVRTGGKLVLIDTGASDRLGSTLGKLENSLARAGVSPSSIDEVLLTHLHIDHVSGLLLDGKPAFPNATVWVDARELAFWTDPSNAPKIDPVLNGTFDVVKDVLSPYRDQGRLKTFTSGTRVAPDIVATEAIGHTPGHTSFVLKSRGQQLVFWGDVIHVGDVQFPAPAITIRFDFDQAQAARERNKALAQAASSGYWIAGAHIAFPGIGHVKKHGDTFVWEAVGEP